MKKLKLLLICKDFSKWIHVERSSFQKELSNKTDLVIWNQSGDIHNIIKQIKFVPDFILIYLFGSINCPNITNLDSLAIPYGVYVEDLHSLQDFQSNIEKNKIKYIFNCYRDAFQQRFPQLMNKMIWFPHHIDLNLFKDLNQPRDILMLLMGSVNNKYYPLRYQILQKLNNHHDFTYHKHPGYRNIEDDEDAFVREKYVLEINKAKIFFTCDSIYKYPINKYYEIPACKTLLLAPNSRELYDLGFRDGENFVEINNQNFLEKAEYYLNNDQERNRITMNGYNLVCKKHSTIQRVKEFIKSIEKILINH